MKVISTIALLAVFAFTSLNTFAQNGASEDVNDPNITQTAPKSEIVKTKEPVKEVKPVPTRGVQKSLSATEVEQKKKGSANANSDLPYLNYKGIANQDEAKKAWIADHPKEYSAMQGEKVQPYHNYKGIKDLDKAKEAWVKDHPEEYKKR